MIPLFESVPAGAPGYRLAEFQQRLTQICQDHQNKGRALAFALICYREQDVALQKVLNDHGYWNALDETSDHYLSVFAHQRKSLPTSFWIRPSSRIGERTKRILKDNFSDSVELPGILFFQVSRNIVIDHLYISLRANRIEESFLELESIIKLAVGCLQEIEVPANPDNVFRELK